MGPSQRNCALLLAVVAVACIEFYQAQTFIGRCTCKGMARNVKGNISDYILFEKTPGCNRRELVATITRVDNSTFQSCLHPLAKIAKDLIQCWESINKTESRKKECLYNKKKKVEDRTLVESST